VATKTKACTASQPLKLAISCKLNCEAKAAKKFTEIPEVQAWISFNSLQMRKRFMPVVSPGS
jgi:hypothetical protein